MSLYFGGVYAVGLFILTLLMFIYKAVMLPYPPNAIGLEVAFVFFYGLLEWSRIRLGAQRRVVAGLQRVVRARASNNRLPSHSPFSPRASLTASRGNRLEELSTTLTSVLFGAPVIVYHVYLISLQTYVLRLDGIVHGIALAIVLLQIVLGLFAASSFYAGQFTA